MEALVGAKIPKAGSGVAHLIPRADLGGKAPIASIESADSLSQGQDRHSLRGLPDRS